MPTTRYVYNPLTEAYLAETDGDGNMTVKYTQEPVKYGDVLAQHRIDPATGVGESYYYHTDALGSTRELTDSSGNVVNTYTYDAFGNTIASTGTVKNPFRFTGNVGYYFDEELDTYHIRARNYQPTTGRWMSQDPLLFVDGVNLYAFVRNCPLMFVDPTGLDASDRSALNVPDPSNIPFKSYDCSCGRSLTCISLIGLNDCITARHLAEKAKEQARASGLPGHGNGYGDAFKHCFLSCESTRMLGAGQAKESLDLYESCSGDMPPGTDCMESYNNAVGRVIGTRLGSPRYWNYDGCSVHCMSALRWGDLQPAPGCPPGLGTGEDLWECNLGDCKYPGRPK